MNFRLSKRDDIDRILEIIEQGKEYLKEQGVNQWQDGYPNIEVIRDDIEKDNSYVLEEKGVIVGTTVLSFDGEATYEKIYEGSWLSSDKFAVIHRIALDKDYRNSGLSEKFMGKIEELVMSKGIKSIKVDTHRDNKAMQRFLQKNGYSYCGIIYLVDGNERLAFEKII